MSIVRRGKDTFLVRVYLGRDPMTGKRVEVNETVHGSFSYAVKTETKLKEQKYSGRLLRSPNVPLDALFELFITSVRHTVSPTTYERYDATYHRYASPYIGKMSVNKIKHSDIQRLFNFMLDPKKEANGDKR